MTDATPARRHPRVRSVLWLGLALSVCLAFPASAIADTITVNDDDAGPGACATTPHQAIQAGVDAATAGDTVEVCAGTYTEQIEITKDLTVSGAGEGNTIVQSPANSSLVPNWRGNTRRAIFAIDEASDASTEVSIQGLTVDGRGAAGASCSSQNFLGIAYHNAAGTVADVTVTDVRNDPLNGCQQGLAIYNLNEDQAPRSWTVEDSHAIDFQKNGITANDPGLSATITGNDVQGAGLQPIAQNGIQVGFGAGATVEGNTVDGHKCDASVIAACGPDPTTSTQSSGILLFDAAAGTTLEANSITDNDAGILDSATDKGADRSKTVAGNAISENRYEGIYTDEGALQITGNNFTENVIGVAPVSFEDGATDWVPTPAVNGNTVAGNDVGLRAMSSAPAADDPQVAVHFNRFVANATAALENAADGTVAAENNWFGANAGPGAAVTGGVDANPHLMLSVSANPASIETGGAQSQITAGVSTNSAGDTPPGNVFPANTQVDLATSLGTITDEVALNGGSGTGTLTSGSAPGSANVTAALDSQTVGTQVTIVEPPPPPSPDEPEPTSGDDVIDGTAGDDVIEGLGGDDELFGELGNDLLDGGEGNDLLAGGEGDDEVLGGVGDDDVLGGDGNDDVNGGQGGDEVRGGIGDDDVTGGQGDDEVKGGKGNDQISGGSGEDDIGGGSGEDTINSHDGDHDTVRCGPDEDTLNADGKDEYGPNCETVS